MSCNAAMPEPARGILIPGSDCEDGREDAACLGRPVATEEPTCWLRAPSCRGGLLRLGLAAPCFVLAACGGARLLQRQRIGPAPFPSRETMQASADTITDEFLNLGLGHCINQRGRRVEVVDTVTVSGSPQPDGSNSACAEHCRLRDSCSGYEISGRGCGIFIDADLLPSGSDGVSGSRCFWRHRFAHNSSGLHLEGPRPIPKIIWSYWQNLSPHKKPPGADSKGLCAMPAGRPCVFPFTFRGSVHRNCTTAFSDPTDQDGDHQTDDGAPWCGTVNEVTGVPGEWGPCGPCPTETSPEAVLALRSFMDLCLATWKTLNPDYDVRLLDQKSVWKWLGKGDLPPDYEDLIIQHKSDTIRLALLSKYGGVWVDASTILTKPMSRILGTDPSVRTFFTLPTPPALVANDLRLKNHHYHVENWFLAAPPDDPLITRTRTCVHAFLAKDKSSRTLAASGLFSQAQLEMLVRLGVWEYLSTSACMFKTIDEDVALGSWWQSPRVRHVNPVAVTGPWWLADMQKGRKALFDMTNTTMLSELMDDEFFLIKFTRDMRTVLVQGLTVQELHCKNSTFHAMLETIGVSNVTVCQSLTE